MKERKITMTVFFMATTIYLVIGIILNPIFFCLINKQNVAFIDEFIMFTLLWVIVPFFSIIRKIRKKIKNKRLTNKSKCDIIITENKRKRGK